jgi:hypothetical protein
MAERRPDDKPKYLRTILRPSQTEHALHRNEADRKNANREIDARQDAREVRDSL